MIVHAYIEVSDLERGIDFYCRAFGLSLKRRLSPRWVELDGANLPLFLLGDRPPVADLGSTKAPRTYERHWTPVHLDFIISDINEAVARLIALGASLDREIQQHQYGQLANMADPFGNGFDLIEFSGTGYDMMSSG